MPRRSSRPAHRLLSRPSAGPRPCGHAAPLPAPSRLALALRQALLAGVAGLGLGGLGLGALPALAEPVAPGALPVPMPLGGPASWVTTGQATMALSAAQAHLEITQHTDFATYNWQSFNIGAEAHVHFALPQQSSVALNRIFDANPSQILGALTSNGQVYLINANGFVFGAGARVNVGGLVASALQVAEADVQAGLEAAARNGRPAFERFAGERPVGDITVQRGAVITTANGGQVMLFAANVRNDGSIVAPDGQVLLAAGDRIYLSRPDDPNLRGFLVEVENDATTAEELRAWLNGEQQRLARGNVVNTGSIEAAGGQVTLAGLAVRHTGRIRVDRAVNDGGTIRLVAGDVTTTTGEGGTRSRTGERLGSLELGDGAGGQTETRAGTALNSGGRVLLRAAEARIDAGPGGRVEVHGEDVKLLAADIDIAGQGTVEVTGNRLLVSTLDLNPEANPDTLLIASNSTTPPPNLRGFRGQGQSLPSQALVLPENLILTALPGPDPTQVDGGRLFVFAPSIRNHTRDGSLTADQGQVLMAAGEEVFLGRPTDPDLRGYVAEVRNTAVSDQQVQALIDGTLDRLVTGVIENFGSIRAREGSIVLVGPQILQAGRLTTSSSTAVNGGIYLKARDIGLAPPSRTAGNDTVDGLSLNDLSGQGGPGPIGDFPAQARRNGELEFATGSVTEVLLEQDGRQALDAQEQRPSVVRGTGRRIEMAAGSRIVAPAGDVTLFASVAPGPGDLLNLANTASDASLHLAPGSLIDVSGVDARIPESQFLVEVQLFSEQLRDAPLQRDGVLFGERVWVDLRRTGLRADGTRWFGTPLASLENNLAGQPRDVNEFASVGGYVSLVSEGSLLVAPGATIDVSGGVRHYAATSRPTSRVMRDGVAIDIAEADPLVRYDLVFDPVRPPLFERNTGRRWGQNVYYDFSPLTGPMRTVRGGPAIQSGADAGVVELVAARTVFAGELLGETRNGPAQRQVSDRTIDPAAARRALLGVAPLPAEAVEGAIARRIDAVALAAQRRPGTELARGARLLVGRERQAILSLANNRDTFLEHLIVADGVAAALPGLLTTAGRPVARLDAAALVTALPRLGDLASPGFDGSTRYALLDAAALGPGAGLDLTLRANRQVALVQEGTRLDNGTLTALAERIDVAADLIGAGARIGLHAIPTQPATAGGGSPNPTLVVHGGVTLDVSGRFVNDRLDLAAGRPLAPNLIHGGSIALTASPRDTQTDQATFTRIEGGLIDVQPGTRLLAEGAARLSAESVPAVPGLPGQNLERGRGGDLTVLVEPGSSAYLPGQRPLRFAAEVAGQAFGPGGSFRLGAPSTCIGAACADLTALAASDPAVAPLLAELPERGFDLLVSPPGQPPLPGFVALPEGFTRYTLEATGGSLVLAPGATFAPIAQNYAPRPDLDQIVSGAPAGVAGIPIILPPAQRAPMGLRLAMRLPDAGLIGANAVGGIVGHTLDNVAGHALFLGTGSRLALENRGSIELQADSRIQIRGTVEAPGGSIRARLDPASHPVAALSNQSIWLDEGARLLAPGFVLRRRHPSDGALAEVDLATRAVAQVLDGGVVDLVAAAGSVVTRAGSLIDVSAVAGSVGIIAPDGQRVARILHGHAGDIGITAAEGLLLDGSLRAQGAGLPGSEGGKLRLGLNANARGESDLVQVDPALAVLADTNARVLEVVGGPAPSFVGGLTPGTALAAAARGRGFVSANAIAAGGFDRLSLSATNLIENRSVTPPLRQPDGSFPAGSLPIQPGVVRFTRADGGDGLELALGSSLTVDAARIEGAGVDVSLSAPHLQLGYSDPVTALNRAYVEAFAPRAGTARLSAEASGLLELFGNLSVSGFAATTLGSAGELRLRGQFAANPGATDPGAERDRSLDSQLRVHGGLTLAAAAILPTTLSDYTLRAEGPNSRIETRQLGSRQSVLPLSAGGRLRLEAAEIVHGGTLLAPMGSLELVAGESLSVLPGATTSVSPAGLVIPFGRTEFQQDWVYRLSATEKLVFDGRGALGVFPGGFVRLEAPSVNLAAPVDIGAVAEPTGIPVMAGAPRYTDPVTGRPLVGGDLIAWEFFGGLGGSRDILDASVNPAAFAVLPGHVTGFAPRDPDSAIGGTPIFGRTVTLDGGAGLAAGTYTVLPARFALLPGAFLVEPVPGSEDYATPPAGIADGSVVSAGYFGVAGTGFRDSRSQGFRISPRTTVDARAEYRMASASNFFRNNRATADDVNPSSLDAARLLLSARDSLIVAASLNAASALGGLGSQVDVSRSGGGAIAIVPAGAGGPAGALRLEAEALSGLGASSLLVGGVRRRTAEGVVIDTQSGRVSLEAGAELRGGDVILTAREELRLAAGSLLEGRGGLADPRAHATSGDGALVRVSGERTEPVTRSGATGAGGDFLQEADARVAATGAIQVGGSRGTRLEGDIDLARGLLSLSALQFNLGETAGLGSLPGLTLDNAQLAGIRADAIALLATHTIDFYGRTELSTGQLTLDAAALRGRGSTPAAVALQGERLTLTRSGSARPEAASGGTGSLTATFDHIDLGPGTVDLAGFATSSLTAAGQLRLAGDGALNLREGQLTLAADRYLSAAGVDYHLELAAGDAHLLATAGPGLPAREPGQGGRLAVTAEAVTLGGRFALPAGALEATARTRDVEVTGTARLDVSGRAVQFDDLLAGGDGGVVRLEAQRGNVFVAPAARIDASADARTGHAGAISLLAPAGQVEVAPDSLRAVAGAAPVAGSTANRGGSLGVDALRADPASLVAAAIAGGFSERLDFRLRTGDWTAATLPAGQRLAAREITLALDGQDGGGHFTLAGILDASGPAGGSVTIDARRSLTLLGGAQVLARGTAAPVADTIAGAESVAARGGEGGTVRLRVAGVLAQDTPSADPRVTDPGRLTLAAGSAVDVSALAGGQAGRIELRAQREAVTGGGVTLAGSLAGGRTTLQAVRVYADEGTLTATDTQSSTEVGSCGGTRFCTDAASFMGQAGLIEAALGQAGSPGFDLLPEVEIRTNGNLLLASDWSLHTWRFADPDNAQRWLPGVLTLRATGNLDIGIWNPAAVDTLLDTGTAPGRLSDGFNDARASADANLLTEGALVNGRDASESWSFRLNAGADLDAANPLALRPLATLPSDDAQGLLLSGNFRVAKGQVVPPALPAGAAPLAAPVTRAVRTGTGSLEVAAAGDIRLGNGASALYTAGRASREGIVIAPLGTGPGALRHPRYPVGGGGLSLTAGRDIVQGTGTPGDAPVPTAVSEFMVRAGGSQGTGGAAYNRPVAWTVDFTRFQHGVGALGGGDVTIRAGRDVNSLTASLPSIGMQVGDANRFVDHLGVVVSSVAVRGGGDLELAAGRDILAGQFYVGLGEGRLAAGGSIRSERRGSAATNRGHLIDTLLVADAARFDLTARRDLHLESVLNATVLPASVAIVPRAIGQRTNADTAFFTYGAAAAVSARAAGGTVSLRPDVGALHAEINRVGNFSVSDPGSGAYDTLPPELRLVALSGDVSIGSLRTHPSPRSTIELLAAGDIRLPSASGSALLQSDADPLAVASMRNPNMVSAGGIAPPAPNGRPVERPADFRPNRLVALTGSIATEAGSAFGYRFDFARPTHISTGQDLDSLQLQVQHLLPGDVSRVSTAGSLVYPAPRSERGDINLNALVGVGIVVHGPGRLELVAGRDIDLGVAEGIDTVGNRLRPLLPDGGADIHALAGLAGQPTAFGDFLHWVAASYQALRAASLVAVDPDTRRPIPLPRDASFRLEGRLRAAEGEVGDPATLVLLAPDGSVASHRAVRVITDPVDLSPLFPGATDDAAVSAALRALIAGAGPGRDRELLAPGARVLFSLADTLGGNQTPLENAIRAGVDGIRLPAVAKAAELPQHPITLFYEGVARFFPASGDRNLLRPLLEFGLGITTLDDSTSIAARLAEAGGALSPQAIARLLGQEPGRAPGLSGGGVAEEPLSAAEAAAEAEASRRVFAVRQASLATTVDRLRRGAALVPEAEPLARLLTAPDPATDSLIAQIAGQGSPAAIAALYNGLLEGREALGAPGYAGNIALNFSRINTLDGGDINLLAPGGDIDIGGAQTAFTKRPVELGLVARDGGSQRFLASGAVNVNLSRIFATPNLRTPGNESILGISTTGDIDAGRGAQTVLSAPDPLFTFDAYGTPRVVLGAPLSGSGIRSFDPRARDVFVTPVGVLDTNEAGIFSEGEVVPPPIVVGAAGIAAAGAAGGGGGAIAAPPPPDVAAAAVNDATNRAAAAGQGSVADAARAANEGGQGMGVLRVEVLSFFGQGAQEEGEEL